MSTKKMVSAVKAKAAAGKAPQKKPGKEKKGQKKKEASQKPRPAQAPVKEEDALQQPSKAQEASGTKVLFIDNFDSFTYNLVDEFEKRGCEVLVYRNSIDMQRAARIIERFQPHLIVISPGPSGPRDAGVCIDLIRAYYDKIPMFGVCLGHQCMIEAFGGIVDKAGEIYHGKPSRIKHDNEGIFKGLPNPFQAGRYHSLTGIDIPYCFEISARSEGSDLVMAIRHKEHKLYGVQFHPESILTPIGHEIIESVLALVKRK